MGGGGDDDKPHPPNCNGVSVGDAVHVMAVGVDPAAGRFLEIPPSKAGAGGTGGC